jgi:hypothetical protein
MLLEILDEYKNCSELYIQILDDKIHLYIEMNNLYGYNNLSKTIFLKYSDEILDFSSFKNMTTLSVISNTNLISYDKLILNSECKNLTLDNDNNLGVLDNIINLHIINGNSNNFSNYLTNNNLVSLKYNNLIINDVDSFRYFKGIKLLKLLKVESDEFIHKLEENCENYKKDSYMNF